MFWVDFIGSPHVTLANTKVQPLKSCQKLSFRQKVEGFFWGQTKKSTSKIHVFFLLGWPRIPESERIMLYSSLAQHLEGIMFAFL